MSGIVARPQTHMAGGGWLGRSCNALCVLLFLLLSSAGLAFGQSQEVGEYQLKAAFLYNFARFVEWQPVKSKSNIVFCIASDEVVAEQIEKALAGRMVESRTIQVQRLRRHADVSQCNVIFVAESSPKEFRSVALQVSGMEILTVSESREFPRLGGIINFYVEQQRVRFEIAIAAADRAGLKLSSKLLSLGRLVRDPGNGAR